MYRKSTLVRRSSCAAALGVLVALGCGPVGSTSDASRENVGESAQALGSFTGQLKLDIGELLYQRRVKATVSTLDLGGVRDMFDDSTESLARSAAINPMVATLEFDTSPNFKKTRMFIATEGLLTLEVANTLSDLNRRSGSYVLAVNDQPLAPNTWGSWSFNATGKFVRATVTRINGDDFVHVNEWELEANVTINDIKVSPSTSATSNAVKLLNGKSVQLVAKYLDTNKYPYLIPHAQTWSSSNTGVANVDNTGRTTAGGTPGSATLNVAANGVSQTVALTTTTSFTQTKDAGRTRKVALVLRNPPVVQHGNQPMHQAYGWNDPNVLVAGIIAQFAQASANTINYKVVANQIYNLGPSNLYTEFEGAPLDFAELTSFYDQGRDFWLPKLNAAAKAGTIAFEYEQLVTDLQLCEKRNAGLIDEVWVYTDPYGGMFESRITNPEGFPYNSPPLLGTTCNRQLPIMGLNYETGIPNAMESFGHRLENVGTHLLGRWDQHAIKPNDWEMFATIDADKPGQSHVGDAHFAPNSASEREYNNLDFVNSFEQTWQYYPFLMDIGNATNCNAWGCSHDGFNLFMFGHVPRFTGMSNFRLNNWWYYFVDFLEAQVAARNIFTGTFGSSTLGFESSSSWTASNGTKSLDTAAGERTHGNASLKMTGIGSGVTLTSSNMSSSSVTVSNHLSVDVRVPTQLANQNGAQVQLCLKSPQRGISNYVCSAQNSLNGIGISAAPTFYTVPWTLPTATLNALKAGSFPDLQVRLILSGIPAAAQSATWIFDRGVFFGP